MLTADLVHARRQKGELKIVALSPARRTRAEELAQALWTLARAHVGATREELESAWSAIDVEARDRKLADGLKKLVEDGLTFEVMLEVDPIVLRREVFELAARRRRELEGEAAFDRRLVLREIAAAREMDAATLERALYADLRSAHVLREMHTPPPAALIESYDVEQARAVLLRATRVVAWIHDATPAALRALFRKLKFLRLLHSIHRESARRYRIELDGPFSLFESVTKYGLSLALALPAIASCGEWEICADVRWGPGRTPLVFRLAGDARPGGDVPARLPDEVEALLARFVDREHRAERSGARCRDQPGGLGVFPTQNDRAWTAEPSDEVLELPGIGLCVPDLAFTHRQTGEVIYLEVLGFWSRDAVWKRVELVQRGLPQKILFALSSRLRVSEQVLDDDLPGALYVYKGAMSAPQVERKLDELARR